MSLSIDTVTLTGRLDLINRIVREKTKRWTSSRSDFRSGGSSRVTFTKPSTLDTNGAVINIVPMDEYDHYYN
ncbi:hypothetical protein J6590_024725 [Homalodisca vitripennis]|nr:hypothetical protein J6590_024725 [Homalodisca vitripennis]